MQKIRKTLGKAARDTKAYYQYILSAILILLLILIVYWRDLQILAGEALQSEALSHLILIPFFVAILFYLKKDMIKASVALENYRKKTKYVDELIGASLCLVAFLVYWYGSYTFFPLEYHLLSLPIFVMGITLILFNLKTLRVLIFPILFLLFIIPPPVIFLDTVGGAMANFNTQASFTLLKTLGVPATLFFNYGSPTIALPNSPGYAVDLPCSGVYSLVAFAMFAAFLMFVASAPILKKIALFIVGFFVFEVLSIVRITTIISVGYWFGEEIAMFLFHTVAGLLLIFIGMMITLFVAERFLKVRFFPKTTAQPRCSRCMASMKKLESFCLDCGEFLSSFRPRISPKFWTKISLLMLGCSIATLSINAPVFAIAQQSIEVTSGWEKANIIPPVLKYQDVNYTLEFSLNDVQFASIAGQDAALMYTYFPSNDSRPVIYMFVNIANTVSNLHSWEVCLITWQTAQGRYPLVSTLDSRDIELLRDVPIIARYLAFKDEKGIYLPKDWSQVTLYWYEKATFNIANTTVAQKFVRISLAILTNSTSYKQFEEELLSFGQVVASLWEPLKNQSLISLGVPAQQLLLAFSIGFVAFTETAQYSNEWRKKTNNLRIFNNFAAAKEKFVLQTVLELAKEKKTMKTADISAAITQKTGKTVKSDDLLKMLNNLEAYGFIRKDIVSVENKPVLVWKA